MAYADPASEPVPSSQVGPSAQNAAGKKLRIPLKPASQVSIVNYLKEAVRSQSYRREFISILEYLDREYARMGNVSTEHLKAKRENRDGIKKSLQEVTVPVIQPQVDAALSYLAGVFTSGYPIFGLVAQPGETQKIADQFETVIADHSTRSGWVRHIIMALRDALKYNLCCLEVDWKKNTTYSIVTDEKSAANQGRGTGKSISWEGNVMKKIDLYNAFFDWRVAPAEVHIKGEFAGYVEINSRTALKQLIADLPEAFNIKEAFASSYVGDTASVSEEQGDGNFYVPCVTDKIKVDPTEVEFNWAAWMTDSATKNQTMSYSKDNYETRYFYCRILPSDFEIDVPAKNTVQIWKFITVNNVLIYAERLTNAHNYLPLVFGQPIEDGLGYQTPSFAENLLPIQEMASTLWNIRIAAARRNVTDRVLYDPTRVKPDDINSSNPAAKIPVRPNAYGKPVSESVYAFPYRDDASRGVIGDALQIVEFGRSITGINRAQEGQFTKGNRTLQEFDTTFQRSNDRLQMMAVFLESQFFTPIKEIIKANMLQYLVSGKFYSRKLKQTIEVNPVEMRQAALEFIVTDGLIPGSKVANMEFLSVLVQMLLQPNLMPYAMQRGYDVFAMINHLASLQNVPGLDNFMLPMQPQQTQGAGNATLPQNGGAGGVIPGGNEGTQ